MIMAFLYCVRHIYPKKYYKEDFYMKEVKQPKKPLIFKPHFYLHFHEFSGQGKSLP